MEFKHLQSFVEAARTQNFTKAASNLFITQPCISGHIGALEKELGVTLFDRSGRVPELTEDGKKLYRYACDILALQDKMVQSCSSSTHKVLHIGASSIPSAYVLPQILGAYCGRFPDVAVNVCQSDSAEIIRNIASGLYDYGLVGMYSPTDGLTFVPLCDDRMVLLLPNTPHYRALSTEKDPLAALLQSPIILREEGSGSGLQMQKLLNSAGLTERDITVAVRTNDQESIPQLVAQGVGIALVSEKSAAAQAGDFLVYPLGSQNVKRNLYLVSRSGKSPARHIREFETVALETLRKSAAQQP